MMIRFGIARGKTCKWMIKPSSARQRHLDLVVGALMPDEQMPDGLSIADIAPRQMREIERILDGMTLSNPHWMHVMKKALGRE